MENFIDNNYNYCQAIVCAYCEELGLSEDVAFKLTEGFGSGMGGLRDTCGAVTGMFLVISLANSAGDKNSPLKSKQDTYNKFQEVAKLFKEKCGSIYCRDLKNMEKNKILSCEDCVQVADEILKKHYFK